MADCLVVGHGSIGARHARLLAELGHRVAVVSGRASPGRASPGAAPGPVYRSLAAALTAGSPDYVVIANETAGHRSVLAALAECGFAGTVLAEKPLFARPRPLPDNRFRALFVGYNLRFHPLIQELRRRISAARSAGEQILAVEAYAGQYLPDWRPGRDVRRTASASAARGGGALRDLSHELDLLLWLFGPWQRLAALGGRFGTLDIDSDDAWALVLRLEGCPLATLQLNYFDRPGRRRLVVHSERHTYLADLTAGTLTCDGQSENFTAERDATYREEHRAALAGDDRWLCGAGQGLAVVGMIEAVERAARDGAWVAA